MSYSVTIKWKKYNLENFVKWQEIFKKNTSKHLNMPDNGGFANCAVTNQANLKLFFTQLFLIRVSHGFSMYFSQKHTTLLHPNIPWKDKKSYLILVYITFYINNFFLTSQNHKAFKISLKWKLPKKHIKLNPKNEPAEPTLKEALLL